MKKTIAYLAKKSVSMEADKDCIESRRNYFDLSAVLQVGDGST